MAEIQCPQCGTVISLEQSDLDSVVRQVRDEEFKKELVERQRVFDQEKQQAMDLLQAKMKAQEQERLASMKESMESQMAQLQDQLAQAKAQEAQTVARIQAEAAQSEARSVVQIEQLKNQLDNQAALAQSEQKLAIAQAVADIEKERDALSASIELQSAEHERASATLREQMASQLKMKDDVIAYQNEEIARIKDMRARLTTKLVGESLEQHCQYEFDRIRATAFPNAYFEKDNAVAEGTKGDFVFREADEDGNEFISIMFEMKNEEDASRARKRNEDHLAKLDRDRAKKNCEYAVLVSLLEPENELYNEGIVDVSHRYPKMYVIRPQFFIALISLLRNAALGSLTYRRELALVRQQELDITNFEQDLDTFKQGFFKNFTDASLRFDDAIKAIDKAIADLQRAKEKLQVSEKHLSSANNKLEGLTVKKLVRKNPTMKERFAALQEPEEVENATTVVESTEEPAESDSVKPKAASRARATKSKTTAKAASKGKTTSAKKEKESADSKAAPAPRTRAKRKSANASE